jgi:hypothetical protein
MLVTKIRPDALSVLPNASLLLNNYFTYPDADVWDYRGPAHRSDAESQVGIPLEGQAFVRISLRC